MPKQTQKRELSARREESQATAYELLREFDFSKALKNAKKRAARYRKKKEYSLSQARRSSTVW